MKIKADENIGNRGIELPRRAGHDVTTVREQALGGAADELVYRVCAAENRTLVTLGRDFGQVQRFPPAQAAGPVVLDLGGPATLLALLGRLRDFLALAATEPVSGRLWIVEPGRIRIRGERNDT